MRNSTLFQDGFRKKSKSFYTGKSWLFFLFISLYFVPTKVQSQMPPPAPGGVSSGLALWVKADKDVTLTGANVTGWADQSGNARHLTTSTATYQPGFTPVSALFNYYPTLNFTNDYMRYTSNVIPKNSGASIFTILNQTTQSGYSTVWDFLTNDPGLHTLTNNWTLYHGGNSNYHSMKSISGRTTLMSAHWQHNLAASSFIEINGKAELANRAITTNGNNYYIGAGSTGAVEPWRGSIAENIVYEVPLVGIDLQKVNSYLGVKYGITLDNDPNNIANNYDYVNSSGEVIWDGVGNSAYHHNVFGIGRDDFSDLNHIRSKSANPGNVLIISIPTIDIGYSFMMVGDNGLSNSMSVGYTPRSFVSELPYFHTAKIYKVQETHEIGTVTLTLNGLNANHLLVHNSADFTTGTPQEFEIINGSVSVDLVDGQYFTFAAPAKGPGGVHTNLAIWLRADEGTNTTVTGGLVDGWDDQSGKGRKHNQTDLNKQPSFVGAGGSYIMSYNPAIRFARVSGAANYKSLEVSNYLQTSEAVHVFTVSRINGPAITSWHTLYSFTADYTHPDWYLQKPSMRVGGSEKDHPSFPYKYAIGTALMPKSGNQRHIANGKTQIFTLNTSYSITQAVSPTFTVGVDRNNTDPLDGDISEVIVYAVPDGADMNNSDIERIQSYLAIKYGITLDPTGQPNYIAGDGTTIFWEGSKNTGYQNHIFGLGKDVATALNQKQAYSFSDSSIAIYLGDLAPLNMSNTFNIETDNAYLVFGNNNLNGNSTVNYPVGTNFQNTTNEKVFNLISNKIWKAQATTETAWSIHVKTTRYASARYVLVSADPSFPNAVTRIYPVIDGHAKDVLVNDGEYMRIASYNTAPGGVHNGLALWLRADIGADGSIIHSWLDQSGYGNDLSQENSTYFPIREEGTPARNFNPAVRFNQSSLYRQQSFVPTANGTGISIFSAASIANNSGTYKTLWDFYSNSPTLNALSNNWLFFNMGGNHTNTIVVNKNTIANTHWIVNTSNSRVNEVDGLATSITGSVAAPSSSNYYLGAGNETTLENWIGDIFENIVYTNKIVGDDLLKVNTYLSIKYGTTLKNPSTYQYMATDGTLIWDGANNATYHNNIAGIGYDEVELLNQKQSRSVNTGDQITIGLGTVELNNDANTNSFENNISYLVWGDNNVANASTNLVQYSTSVTMNHLNRIWRVENTNLTQKVMIRIPEALRPGALVGPCEGYKLLISNAPTFDQATIQNIEPVVLENGEFVANFTFPMGESYFTLSRVDPATGGAVYLPLEDITSDYYYDCSMNEWNYFYEGPTAQDKLLGISDFETTELDNLTVHINIIGASFANGARETNVLSRIVNITDVTNATYAGGKVRIYFDPAEIENMTVENAQTHGWFKYSGNTVDALDDILDDGVFVSGSAVALTPAASGIEDGVNYVEFHGITSFSSFMFISSTEITGVVLPVTMGKLTAHKLDHSIQLNWHTFTESNNSRFEIERALPNGQWMSIGSVTSLANQGNSNHRIDYQFEDKSPLSGLNTYRIKQIDIDGRYSYSTLVYVTYQSQVKISIQPNPVITNTTITGLHAGDQIQLYNSHGQLVKSTIATGAVWNMDMSSQGTGIYYLRVLRNGESHTMKILKVR